MEATKSLATGLLLAGVFMSFMTPSAASDFMVGGRAGWVQSPIVPYNNWASAMRFQVHDSLVFKYKKGDDSVLVVNKSGYDSCNTTGPLEKLDGGDSVYKLARTGPNYFISGAAGHCDNGQKLIVVVMANRNKSSPQSPFVVTPPALPPSMATPRAMPPSVATSPSVVVPPSLATPPAISPSIAMPPSIAVSPSPTAEAPMMASSTPTPLLAPSSSPAEAPMVSEPLGVMGPPGPRLSPVSAMPPADKGSSSSVLSVSGVALGMATLLLGGVLFG